MLKTSATKPFTRGDHGGLLYINRRSSFGRPLTFFNADPKQKGKPARLVTARLLAMQKKFSSTMYEERRRAISQQLQRAWGEALPVIGIGFGPYRSVKAAKMRRYRAPQQVVVRNAG